MSNGDGNSAPASPLFTVFTPTYNRAHTLGRLFDSLMAQSCNDFEWLVLDDGSTDDTAGLIESMRARATFAVRYFWQTNGGKHVALDRAVDLARGALFLPVDSDDSLVGTALERLRALWLEIPPERRPAFCGLTAACMTAGGQLVGSALPGGRLDCSSLDAVFKWRVVGERFGFHRTEVLREVRFPVGRELPFVPEGVLWFAVARRFLTRFVDEPLRVYHTEGKDRLTLMVPERNGPGLAYYSRQLLVDYADFARYHPRAFFKAAVHYVRFGRALRATGVALPGALTPIGRLFIVLGLLPGLLLRQSDRWRGRRARQFSSA